MANYKIIGGDHKEYGPVTAEELRIWIQEGRLSAQSLAQAENTAEWKPLVMFPEFAEALRAQTTQNHGARSNVAAVNYQSWTSEILAHHPRIEIGECLSRSWALLKGNFGLFFGASILAWLIGSVFQLVPFIGPVLYWFVNGVLYGGLYLVVLNRIRGKPASVGDVFAGFSLGFGQLALAGFITSFASHVAMVCCLVLPGVYLFIAWIFAVPLVADKRLEFWSAMETSRKLVNRVWFEVFGVFVLAYLPMILMSIFVQLKISTALIPMMQGAMASQKLDFQQMLETMSRVAGTSATLIVASKIVLLLNLPFAAGALMYAYETLFGTRTPPSA